jgi:hypothetical protein
MIVHCSMHNYLPAHVPVSSLRSYVVLSVRLQGYRLKASSLYGRTVGRKRVLQELPWTPLDIEAVTRQGLNRR